MFLFQTLLCKALGRKGQCFFCIHPRKPGGVHRCKQQLACGFLLCGGVCLAKVLHGSFQLMLRCGCILLPKAMPGGTLLQLLRPHERGQRSGHGGQLIGKGGKG